MMFFEQRLFRAGIYSQKSTLRDSGWSDLAIGWLKDYPGCAACGRKKGCVPHHIIPVHVDRKLEMSLSNLITLCPKCHLVIGHGGNWRHYVEKCREIASALLGSIVKHQ